MTPLLTLSFLPLSKRLYAWNLPIILSNSVRMTGKHCARERPRQPQILLTYGSTGEARLRAASSSVAEDLSPVKRLTSKHRFLFSPTIQSNVRCNCVQKQTRHLCRPPGVRATVVEVAHRCLRVTRHCRSAACGAESRPGKRSPLSPAVLETPWFEQATLRLIAKNESFS